MLKATVSGPLRVLGQAKGLEANEPLLRLGIGQVRDRIDREGGQLTRARDCVTKVGPEAGPMLKWQWRRLVVFTICK